MKNKVLIYDAIMGSGKTTNAIKRMKSYEENGQKFIFVTPFLDEITRVRSAIGSSKIVSPEPKMQLDKLVSISSHNKIFKYTNKHESYKRLLKKGKSIATTHSLFTSLSIDDVTLFKDYILIIDEAINPVSLFEFGARDIEILFNEQLISKDDRTNEVSVTDNQYKDNSFKEVLSFCSQDNVFLYNNTFISLLPIEILKGCKQVEILTYLFGSSLMASYFKLHKIEYCFINKVEEKLLKHEIKNNLNIYLGDRNQQKRTSITAFSKNYLNKRSKMEIKKIKVDIAFVLKYEFKTKSHDSAFTIFKDCRKKYSGRGYTKGFIAINARATNEFSSKKSMVYIGNRYLNPAICNSFKDNGVEIDQDYWALSELIQWVWRGCIRNDEKMNLYIPSIRMRTLLISWMNNEY